MLVFESNFLEGDNTATLNASAGPLETPVETGRSIPLRTIPSVEPFEVLHPLLYYLYTDRICFTTAPIAEATSISGVPPCDPEDAYRVADLFGLPKLKERALKFLLETTEKSNIIARVFGEYSITYEELGMKYKDEFYKYWNSVRKSGDLKKYIEKLETDGDEKRRRAVTQRCLELMEGLVSQDNKYAK